MHTTYRRYALPEMLRTPLEELCLEIGSLRLGPPQVVLAKALSPPPPETVARAIASLQMLGALADEEGARLSTLGAALARLAVHPRLGKLLLLSGLFRCVQPMLTIAAGLGYKSPFLCPLGKEREADRTLTLTQNLALTLTLTLTLTPALLNLTPAPTPTLTLTRSARRTRRSVTLREARAPTISLWCARSTAGWRGATASRRATSCRRPPSSTLAGCGAT